MFQRCGRRVLLGTAQEFLAFSAWCRELLGDDRYRTLTLLEALALFR